MNRRFLLAPSLVLLGLIALWGGRAEACATSITGPCTITAAGTYNVNADFSTSGGASAITLNVTNPANVTINLNNHNITGSGGTGSGIGVSGAGQNNVALIGPGLITGFGGAGITLGTGTSAIVRDVTVLSSGTSTASGGAGINVGDGALVTGCIAESNGNTAHQATIAGISCGNGCSLSGNVADSNTGSGIAVGTDGSILNNSMSNNTQYGLNDGSPSTSGLGENVMRNNNNNASGFCATSFTGTMSNNICNGGRM